MGAAIFDEIRNKSAHQIGFEKPVFSMNTSAPV
jgi:hypothetical protein